MMGDSTGSGPNDFEIDLDGLATHQQHLGALIDRVETARGAARTTLTPDAFGLLGGDLAGECAQAQRDGADTLQVALDASRDHHQKVGAWVDDHDTHQLNVVEMFRVVGGEDDR